MNFQRTLDIRNLIIASFGAITLLTSNPAFAGLVIYGTELTVSDDGKFVLVRIFPKLSLEEELATALTRSAKDKIQAIRTTYPESGRGGKKSVGWDCSKSRWR